MLLKIKKYNDYEREKTKELIRRNCHDDANAMVSTTKRQL